jgi:hypothetical protein
MQVAKTITALDLISNPHYVMDLLLHLKLLKEITLTGDVRICDGNRGSEATAKATSAVGGEEAKVVPILQAR